MPSQPAPRPGTAAAAPQVGRYRSGVAERIDPAERLLDLLIALTHAPGRLTKAQIRRTVNGYHSASESAFERMFERDKELLRELGVPVVTETDVVNEADVGYRIDAEEYQLPPIELTAAEIGVLSVAADVWQDASLHGPARRGLTKLRAVAPGPATPGSRFDGVRIAGPEPVFETLLTAIAQRRHVAFDYRAAATGEVTARHVAPWRLVSRDRGWYLLGHDVARQAPRAFRLGRVRGRVRLVGDAGAYEIPAHDPSAMIDGRRRASAQVRLAVRPGRAIALRARGEVTGELSADGEQRDVVTLSVNDVHRLAEELPGYGQDVVVLSPPELREAVVRRLRAVAGLAGES